MTWKSGTFGFDPIADLGAIETNIDGELAELIAEAHATG